MTEDIKFIYCTGNLKTSGNLTVQYSQSLQLSQDVWQVAIKDIIFDLTDYAPPPKLQLPVGVSLNFVKGYNWSVQNRRFECVFPQLNLCLLERSTTSTKKHVKAEIIWSYINNLNEQLTIYFENLETGQPFVADCKVYVLVLLRRIHNRMH
jgi:hypothetical protein